MHNNAQGKADPLADGVDPDRAQQVVASDQGRHYSLHTEIKVDSCFAEKCRFLADGVDPDWAQQVAASNLGRHYSLPLSMGINFLNGILPIFCFIAVVVGPD